MLVLLVVVLIPHVGSQHFGAQRWFQVGPLSVQPSAIAVGVAIVFFSRWLTDREGSVRSLRVSATTSSCSGAAALVLAERDFGSSIVIAATALILLALPGAEAASAADHRRLRRLEHCSDRAGRLSGGPLAHFLNPCAAALGSGSRTVRRSTPSAPAGFRVGLGNSVQKYEWLPEAHTDSSSRSSARNSG